MAWRLHSQQNVCVWVRIFWRDSTSMKYFRQSMFLLKMLLNKKNFPWDLSQILHRSSHPIWMFLTENLQSDQLEIWFTKSFQLCSFENRSHLDKRPLRKNEVIEEMCRCWSICYYYFFITTPGWYEEIQYEMGVSESSCCRTESTIHIWTFFHWSLKGTNGISTCSWCFSIITKCSAWSCL